MSSPTPSDVDDEAIMDAVKELTPAGTQEVADRIGLTRQATEYRLKNIEERASIPAVWSKKIGPTRVWLHSQHIYPR